MFWLFGGTPYWKPLFTDAYICPECYHWATLIFYLHHKA
jgi:hypothetical protein